MRGTHMPRLPSRIIVPIAFAVVCAVGISGVLTWQAGRTRALLGRQLVAIRTQEQADDVPLETLPAEDIKDAALNALREGDLAALEGDWKRAQTLYQRSVDARGGVPALRKLMQAQLQRRDIPAARETLTRLKLAGARPEDVTLLEALMLLRTGELQQAQQFLNTADESPQRSYGEALLSIVQGSHEAAQTSLHAVENGWDPILRANARILMGAYEEYSLFPESPNIHLIALLSRALAQVHECELALPLLSQVTRQQDDYRDAWIVQGYCELTTERLPEALSSFERAYALDPEKPETQFFLGRTYAAQGDHASALTFFQYALKNGFQPEADARRAIAKAAFASGNTTDALEQYDILTAAPDAEPAIFEEYADVALSVHLIEEALARSTTATERWPNNARVWFLLGRTAVLADKRDRARSALEKALEIDPDFTAARAALQAL